MKRLLSFLHIENLGLLELMLAFYPIIMGYSYGPFPMSVLWLLLMDVIAIMRHKGILHYRLMVIVFAFVLFHEVAVLFIDNFMKSHVNVFLTLVIFLASIFIIAPALDYKKLKSSIYLIAYVVCGGIIYHFILLLSGSYISPIPLPFLPAPDESSRLFEDMNRPCSFFWEPASFVTYMLIPLFISLMDKDWKFMLFFVFCIFLSTSTNGIILAPVMIIVYATMGRQKITTKAFIMIALIGMGFWLFNSSLFEGGTAKLEGTDFTQNVRVSNGPWLVSQMPTNHIILGVPAYSADQYLSDGYVTGDRIGERASFFLSDFWRVLVLYGVFGLFLHLLLFFNLAKKEKTLWPYIATLLVAQFSQSVAFRSTYVFQLCFILAYIAYCQNVSLGRKITVYNKSKI